MNIPNRLTIMRLLLVPALVAFIFLEIEGLGAYNNLIACAIFLLASLTDFLDGFLARKLNQVTDFGKLFDPAADKLLCGSALISLVYVFTQGIGAQASLPFGSDNLYAVMMTAITIIIIGREMFTSAFRAMAAKKNIVIAADMPGKIKTVVQMVGIILLLAVPDLVTIAALPDLVMPVVFFTGMAALLLGTLLALISCTLYLVKYKEVFSEK